MMSYAVYYYCAKDGCRHSLAVFGVLGRAHDDVVAAGEHAADGAEDYDGEDGDDDAVGCAELVKVLVRCTAFPALFFMSHHPPLHLFLGRRTMSMR